MLNTTRVVCRYCIGGLDTELEKEMHCDGIWLHALQYEGDSWKFRTSTPEWANHLLFSNSSVSLDA